MVDFLSSNPFWLFLGIVAGALIQHVLGIFDRHRQARAALKVLQVEVKRNLEEASRYIAEIDRQLTLFSSGELDVDNIFFPMSAFDYSALGPLNNSGYLHLLLGSQALSDVLRFNGHFNNETGKMLHSVLQQRKSTSSAASFLQEEKGRAVDYRDKLETIMNARKEIFRLKLKYS